MWGRLVRAKCPGPSRALSCACALRDGAEAAASLDSANQYLLHSVTTRAPRKKVRRGIQDRTGPWAEDRDRGRKKVRSTWMLEYMHTRTSRKSYIRYARHARHANMQDMQDMRADFLQE